MTDELPIGDYYKRALTLSAVYLRPDEALDELAANRNQNPDVANPLFSTAP